MKSTKKTLIALGVVAAMGISGAANAGVLASTTFNITNFLLSNNGGATLALTDFTALVATNNGGVEASLTGFGSAGTTFNLPITDPNTDLTRACVGTCGLAPAENNFTVLTPPPVGQFSNADQQLTGSALDLGAGTTGANARVRSDVSLTGEGVGSANADVGLNATFIFSLVSDIIIGVDFNAAVDLRSFTDVGTVFPGNAQTSTALEIVLTRLSDGADIFTFNDNAASDTGNCTLGIGRTLNRNAPFNGLSSYSCSGSYSALTPLLTAGTTYQLSIRQNVNADASFVPEPGVLSMLGLGLLGMGAALRKRKAA